jgi:hypothetical protein
VLASELIDRASMRVALASRAIEEAAADLFRARRLGVPLGDAGVQLEYEATRIEALAAETGALQVHVASAPIRADA